MSYNAVIGWPRWTEGFTFTAASAAAGWEAANLSSLPLGYVWRSVGLDTAHTWIKGTSATRRRIGMLGLVRHNFSITARHRLRLYADEAMTVPLYDSGWRDVWPVVYRSRDLPWEAPNWWSGKYTAEELSGGVWLLPMWLGGRLYVARGLHWEFADPDNADGYVQVGLCEIAAGWQVSSNFDYDAGEGFRPRTQLTEAMGGCIYPELRDKPRVFQGMVRYMDRDEAMARGFEHQRAADLKIPFLWLPHPGERRHWVREAFLARNKSLGLLAYAAKQAQSLPLNFEEVL